MMVVIILEKVLEKQKNKLNKELQNEVLYFWFSYIKPL